MLEMLRNTYFGNDDSASELLDAEVLMIDDLGSEPLMQNITVEQLFNLLNERQNRGLSTVISTNLEMPKFRERYMLRWHQMAVPFTSRHKVVNHMSTVSSTTFGTGAILQKTLRHSGLTCIL